MAPTNNTHCWSPLPHAPPIYALTFRYLRIPRQDIAIKNLSLLHYSAKINQIPVLNVFAEGLNSLRSSVSEVKFMCDEEDNNNQKV
ncbi:hypothetical protein HNY73_005603 [Argiope bruennichi]|uniref:Uncharacterized protein n=1 Tax=Argiope bruennichi TaxID=94029 RepID=A0A8T0FH50_ARGBR|nr:hypothetical protein HNY73_005603 [Argiope bruennichi]